MATVAELERLNALTQRLVPLSDVQRGELIRAGDWNLITGAIIELARVVLAEGTGGIVGEHEHVEEAHEVAGRRRHRVIPESVGNGPGEIVTVIATHHFADSRRHQRAAPEEHATTIIFHDDDQEQHQRHRDQR